MKLQVRCVVPAFAGLILWCAGPVSAAQGTGAGSEMSWLHHWNAVAIDASGLDHAPPQPGENRAFAEQYGPARASRAMAIVHIAMFDAVAAIRGGYSTFTGLPRAEPETSLRVAVAQAAHDTLVALYPAQAETFHAHLQDSLDRVHNWRQIELGIALGQSAAAAILALRVEDGSQHDEPLVDVDYLPNEMPGHWRQDPVSQLPMALGAYWGEVEPFVLDYAEQFRASPPPALDSLEYALAFAEAKRLGGDGIDTPTERTDEQTFVGIFWAYDGRPSLCAPPRLYNQLTMAIAEQQGLDLVETARLLALVNTAMADAGISIWEAKYHYDLWRPVLGIREADPGTGPTGLGDGNPFTEGDPDFMPLGSPGSNSDSPNFTPPFPTYPSGHAGFGGAVFQVLRRFFGTDDVSFTFVSDEWNGVTVDNHGNVRPLIPRHFESFSQAEWENGQSRIYLGIHWPFDRDAGIAQGRAIGDHVFDRVFLPLLGSARR